MFRSQLHTKDLWIIVGYENRSGIGEAVEQGYEAYQIGEELKENYEEYQEG